MTSLRTVWTKLSLKRKILVMLFGAAILTLSILLLSTIVLNSVLNHYEENMTQNSICYEVQEALQEEATMFLMYTRERSARNEERMMEAFAKAEELIMNLPFDYSKIGEDCYAITWNIRNGYAGYKEQREEFLKLSQESDTYVDQLYELIGIQKDLSGHALRLTESTLERQSVLYETREHLFKAAPWGLAFITSLLLILLFYAYYRWASNIVDPLLAMMESARLEVLKSQVNPHFLFNTLNMISCTAKIEEAELTDKMLICMSDLFRYNLRTVEQEVYLEQELEVLENYFYIQYMRFGDRIQYRKCIEVDETKVKIPSFTLQPLAENAFVHGLSRVEQGGYVELHIWMEEDNLMLSIADNGVGMSKERLEVVREGLKSGEHGARGIGVGNISRRIHMLYKRGKFEIDSQENQGTVVTITIPQGQR